MPSLYPVFLQMEGKNCLVVGGGSVGLRKVQALLECGAWVEVVSPQVCSQLEDLAQAGRIRLTLRPFQDGDERGRFLVFAATGDTELNQHIAQLCHAVQGWLNAVDDAAHCDFYVPALLRRGDVTVAVSTAGSSPLLAGKLRDEIAAVCGEEWGALAQILGEVRERVTTSGLDYAGKKALYASLLQQDFLELLRQGKEEEVRERVDLCISSWLG